MKVIIPMSGHGERFKAAGYEDLKPLIKVEGKAILAHLVEKFPSDWEKVFICNEEHLKDKKFEQELESIAPDAKIISIASHRKGPVAAILNALEKEPNLLQDEEACLINYCDFTFTWDSEKFKKEILENECDGAVLCYTGYHPEYIRPTLYAYCREKEGYLVEIKEKGHFTEDRRNEYASAGSYYFAKGSYVKKYFEQLMNSEDLINGEGYVSLPYKFMLEDKLSIKIFEIDYFMQWGTPSDLEDYLYWSSAYKHYVTNKTLSNSSNIDIQLLMPMAGKGSRFKGGKVKPLRPVLEREMFLSAIDHLPKTENKVLVVRSEFSEEVQKLAPDAKLLSLDEVTEGQAITCQKAIPLLNPEQGVLVSSCDHGLVWDNSAWNRILAEDPDVIVFGQRNYPGAEITPKAFAYISCVEGSNEIEQVSVKEAISDQPRQDLLLVGTFYFRTAQIMQELIDELVQRDIRVNGEYYLDSVINLCLEKNMRALMFESQAYFCWGTPEALQEFNYWDAYFTGANYQTRKPIINES